MARDLVWPTPEVLSQGSALVPTRSTLDPFGKEFPRSMHSKLFLAVAPLIFLACSGPSDSGGAGGGWSWVLSDLKTLLETGSGMEVWPTSG